MATNLFTQPSLVEISFHLESILRKIQQYAHKRLLRFKEFAFEEESNFLHRMSDSKRSNRMY